MRTAPRARPELVPNPKPYVALTPLRHPTCSTVDDRSADEPPQVSAQRSRTLVTHLGSVPGTDRGDGAWHRRKGPQSRFGRWCAGPLWCERLYAELTRPTWVNACGKLPRRRFSDGSYSSESRPRSFETPTSRSNSSRASSWRSCRTSASTSQNEHGRKTPSPPGRPSTSFSSRAL